jgi:hypothetical protein
MRTRVVVGALFVLGCSRPAPPAPATEAAASAVVEPSAPADAEVSPLGDGGLEASQARTRGPDADEGGTGASCPEGMVLIDGDYCTQLELRCDKSWYAKWNDKTICERFEEPSSCVGTKVKKRFCIDRYEYPNERGARPRVMFNFVQAQHLCAAEGKRVCTETEWTMACEGPSYKPYPYGYVRDPQRCNGDREYIEPKVTGHDDKGASIFAFASKDPAVSGPELERLWQGRVSGSASSPESGPEREGGSASSPESGPERPTASEADGKSCVSDYGVWDMPGNADELASSETPEPTSKFDNVTTGGPWLYGVRNQCRPKIYTHNEGFAYYYLSTRCCEEADGKATDPRSPKQIKRHEKWRP